LSKCEERNFKHDIINELMLVKSLGEVDFKIQKSHISSFDESGINYKKHDLDKFNKIPSKFELDDISIGSLNDSPEESLSEIEDFDGP
jgi:hypothetical protein